MELKFEPADDTQRAELVEFNNHNKELFDAIEKFINILADWADDKLNFDN